MLRSTRALGTAVVALGALTLGVPGAAHAAADTVTLPGSAAAATTPTTALGAVPGTETRTIQVWLTPDLAGATQFADAVSTPGSPQFHQYLSPDQYTARFGATSTEAQAVSSWLTSTGFTGVTTSPERDYVSATGSVSTIDSAFDVQMTDYRVTGGNGQTTTIDANNQALSVPASLSDDVLSVTGLNSTQPTAPVTSRASSTAPPCSRYWGQKLKTISPAYMGITQSPYSVCGYSAAQMRAAYGQTTANTGVGQTIALIEVGQPTAMFQTLTDYAKANHLPAPRSTQFREEVIGQGGACGNSFDYEEQEDAEAAYAMAPGATELMVDGDSCETQDEGAQALFDADLAVLTGGTGSSASIVSNSWILPDGEQAPASDAATAHAIDLRAAAEGTGMYFASGDDFGVNLPAVDPYSTAVGGTTLGIGQANTRLFETGWSTDTFTKSGGAWTSQGFEGGAGGGASTLYAEPAYQQGVVPPSMSTTPSGSSGRVVPDIAADADPLSGFRIGVIQPTSTGAPGPYQTSREAGTSLATPLVAAMVADAQQGQPASFGFINPLLYSLSSGAYNPTLPVTASTPMLDRSGFLPPGVVDASGLGLLDAQSPSPTGEVTAPGYDTMTGLGTPNGGAFIAALRGGS